MAANYRAACRARSKPEFVAKLGVVEEEADESAFWLELIMETNLLSATKVEPLLSEASEIVAIMASSKKTAAKSQIANRQFDEDLRPHSVLFAGKRGREAISS